MAYSYNQSQIVEQNNSYNSVKIHIFLRFLTIVLPLNCSPTIEKGYLWRLSIVYNTEE